MSHMSRKVLILGDSWVDRLVTSDEYTLSCVPGASLYTLIEYLEVELLTDNYDIVIVIGGVNGYDDEITKRYPFIKLLRNDIFRLENKDYIDDKGYPNDDGVIKLKEMIDLILRS